MRGSLHRLHVKSKSGTRVETVWWCVRLPNRRAPSQTLVSNQAAFGSSAAEPAGSLRLSLKSCIGDIGFVFMCWEPRSVPIYRTRDITAAMFLKAKQSRELWKRSAWKARPSEAFCTEQGSNRQLAFLNKISRMFAALST